MTNDTKMGRPPKDHHRLSVRLRADYFELLREIKEISGKSITNIVEECVRNTYILEGVPGSVKLPTPPHDNKWLKV